MSAPVSPIQKFLPVVRFAMLVTVLLTGGIVWFLRTATPEMDAFADEANGYMRLFFLGFICAIALVVMFVRRKLQEPIALQKKCAFVLMAWAFAEGIALLGAVYNIWGDPTFFGAGLMVLLMTFMVVPVPQAEEANDRF